jgi:hypothetical protein
MLEAMSTRSITEYKVCEIRVIPDNKILIHVVVVVVTSPGVFYLKKAEKINYLMTRVVRSAPHPARNPLVNHTTTKVF